LEQRSDRKEDKILSKYLVEMKHISKCFPGVKALDNVSFQLKSGEVMALLGENGAGKSTLMKILSGVYTSDSGEIFITEKPVENLTPQKAHELGVAIIHQELNMCTHLSVSENIFLGRELTNRGGLDTKAMNKTTTKLLKALGVEIDPETIVGNLPVSKQQIVEIAKALSYNAKVLIMDEPTSALANKEIEELFAIITKLKSTGCGIVYISHRLEELKHITDRVTIMRDGKFITSGEFTSFAMSEIISNMVGREIKEKYPRVSCPKGKKIFEVKGLNAGPLVRSINFELYEGEIVGVAGLMGAGRTEMTRALFGVDSKETGELFLDGKEIYIRSPKDAIQQGIVLAPEDRKKDGLCTNLSVKENIALPNLNLLCNKLGVIHRRKEKEMVDKAKSNFTVKMSDADVLAGSLSGGNQQKIVIAKWLARDSRVVLFDEPTRGIDVAAKVEIYNLINELKKQGVAVLFVSSELPEVLGLADRILIMCNGRITGELAPEEATQDEILKYATKFDYKQAEC